MKIVNITLSWFRGAAEQVELDTKSKSVVIYGANGAGKSSFVDGLEYIIAEGRIEHLAHEYSGSRQEKGIRNTHSPSAASSWVQVKFEDDAQIVAELPVGASHSFSGTPDAIVEEVQSWDLRSFILRQDEVSRFIHSTKGEKYSALLPLLGLSELETAADNFRQLANRFKKVSKLSNKQGKLSQLRAQIQEVLGNVEEETIENTLLSLAEKYLNEAFETQSSLALLEDLQEIIKQEIKSKEPTQQRFMLLQGIVAAKPLQYLDAFSTAKNNIEETAIALVGAKIKVLEESKEYSSTLENDAEIIQCPSCGQEIESAKYKSHIEAELQLHQSAVDAHRTFKKAFRDLENSMGKVQQNLDEKLIIDWLNDGSRPLLNGAVEELRQIDIDQDMSEATLDTLFESLKKLINEVNAVLEHSPPSVNELIEDRDRVSACLAAKNANRLHSEIKKIEDIIHGLASAEEVIRQAISQQTEAAIGRISERVQSLWAQLHPDEPIEGIEIYIPEDKDKAIDVRLKFFDVEQPSPRLTLSEGHRNSLGLCIFLALALLTDEPQLPIILDDVISSFDREHRGMLTTVLRDELKDRQMIVFTHDQDWYYELRHLLSNKSWQFYTLKPWKEPETGIRFSKSTDLLGDALDLLESNPAAAANRARVAMDNQLSLVAEHLRVSTVHLRGSRNEHRTGVDYLNSLLSEKKNFRKKDGKSHLVYEEPHTKWKTARELLIAWGNRGSHTDDIKISEARELIKVCEEALETFKCDDCDDYVWIADQRKRSRLQCSCGELQWRYG